MGRRSFDAGGTFWRCMQELDEIARPLVGQSVVQAIYDDRRKPADTFDDLLLTHPAIYMVEFALACELMQMGIRPDLTLGASLGAIVAATVSGAIQPEDALARVVEQARVFAKHCPPGGMVAVLSPPSLHQSDPLRTISEIASVNFASHFVLAAAGECLPRVRSHLAHLNVPFQELHVAYAFHSRWIEQARMPLEPFMRRLGIRPASVPMVCCVHSRIIDRLEPGYFWEVARQPVEFERTIAHLECSGPYNYVDVGPAGTLATFLKYGLPPGSSSRVFPTLTQFGREHVNIAALRDAIGTTGARA
jgi:acyl transferase domain-containing protein